MKSFASLDLIEPIQRAVLAQNYETMTPIQAQAIPPLLDGHDVLGCAQTGTGKTAAFLLPILNQLASERVRGKPFIRALILTPTRELAAQIGDCFQAYSQFLKLRHLVVFGGVNQRPQVNTLRRGIDVLVATPGRMLDLQNQGHIRLDDVGFFVLDEADRMLDMGFIHDIKKVLKLLPKQRQNLLFSATMPDSIVKLASAFLTSPVRVEVDPQSTTVERIVQSVMFVSRADKKRLLRDLMKDPAFESVIVFTRTKHGANRVAKDLIKFGVQAAAIHGNKTQGARLRALAGFKSGDVRVLVATDIASRGIDVDGVSHVVNYDLPNISESYVHRIGRTGRAGREGVAVAFCDPTETAYLRDIEKLTGTPLDVVLEHEWHCPEAMQTPKKPKKAKGRTQTKQPQQRRGQEGGSKRNRNRRGDNKQGRTAHERSAQDGTPVEKQSQDRSEQAQPKRPKFKGRPRVRPGPQPTERQNQGDSTESERPKKRHKRSRRPRRPRS